MSEMQIHPSPHAQHLIDEPDDWCIPEIRHVRLDATWDQDAGLRSGLLPRPDLWFRITRNNGDDVGRWVESDYLAHRDCNHTTCMDVYMARTVDTQDIGSDPQAMVFAVTDTPDGPVMLHAQDHQALLAANDNK